MEKLIAVFIAFQGFQWIEYNDTKKELERAGYSVITVSNKAGKATASNGSTVAVEKTVDQINPKNYAALVCIGGPGALDNLDTPLVHAKFREAYDAGKVIGAICIAPRIIAHAGILTDKHATGWDDDKELQAVFDKAKVRYKKNQPVVVDGRVVTATGPAAAQAFGKQLGALLTSAPNKK